MKVCFDTFGCRLNRAEALEMEAKFLARGWTITEKHSDADMIVVRGCSVTARAEREAVRLLDHLRLKYPMKRIVATGCLKDRKNERWLKDLAGDAPAVATRTARAYLKAQDGCAGQCTFCTVPKFRGAPVSTPFDKVVDAAKRFVDAGYREIVLTGCCLTQYVDGAKRLPELVAAIAEVDPGCRVRIGSVEPVAIADGVVDAMAGHANICRFLHLPVQSGSPRILTAMKRPYLTRDVEALVHKAAKLMPGIGLGCDLMTGFPDETETDHLATLALLKRLPFTNAHIFPYSERPGTPAATMPGTVAPEARSARAHELAREARKMREQFARRFKGRTVDVVVEDEKRLAGWTSEYLWCETGEDKAGVISRVRRLKGEGSLRKSLVKMIVRDVQGDILAGDLC